MADIYPFGNQYALFVLLLWSMIWIGLALWRASKLEQRNWFIVMLVLNTAGILEILYLFRFAKKRMKIEELQFWKKPTKKLQ